MSAYLILLLNFHYIHQGEVAYVAMQWHKTIPCRTAGTIMLLSFLLSNTATFLIAIDRFILIAWKPFQWRGFSSTEGVLAVSVVSLVASVPVILVNIL